ncbi:MAG: hypothetical protein KGJ23_11985 [Euryarchaeota archaeon]|nr:hypothetical protein [Euryarchaeota archaeon]MDE2045253.1 hypothetical protein [Thermoplasmata archaeon]
MARRRAWVTLRIKTSTKARLDAVRRPGETYDHLLRRLICAYLGVGSFAEANLAVASGNLGGSREHRPPSSFWDGRARTDSSRREGLGRAITTSRALWWTAASAGRARSRRPSLSPPALDRGIHARKILLIGVPGAGKTTGGRWLSRITGFPFHSLSDFRRMVGDGSLRAEMHALEMFLVGARQGMSAILEFSGVGPHRVPIQERLFASGAPVTILWLDPPIRNCLRRERVRGTPHAPTPFHFPGPEKTVRVLHRALVRLWPTYQPRVRSDVRTIRIRTDPEQHPTLWRRRVLEALE